jgi:cellulose biosynthesis protein BcsQ
MRGYQVLAIDCDSQGSLTRSWIEMQLDWLTLSNVLIEPESAGYRAKPRPLPEAVLQSPLENLDLVASDIRLQRFELQQDYMTPRLRN